MTSSQSAVAPHVLILGGAADARALMRALQAKTDLPLNVTLSLAGRTRNPLPPQAGPIAVNQRVGGFGGVAGLAAFIREQRVACIVNATHPFAARMAANAVEAAALTGTPLLRLVRPAWTPEPGDNWRQVASIEAAVTALGEASCRVFLTIGRQNLAAFMAAPQHVYLARTIEAADAGVQFPHVAWLQARGPFSLDDERQLLIAHRIDVLVTKNSGGDDAAAKLAAARMLGVPVVMIDRPPSPGGAATQSAAEAVAWLRRVCLQQALLR
ncbi:cobalt-precorrin-6A reductase [Camelimonas sp. ID_303_24]